MRLRSSQFVFLLLLVCSVQSREDYALRLVAGVVSGRSSHDLQSREIDAVSAQRSLTASLPGDLPPFETRLDAASLAAESTPWTMPHPALGSAAVSSFTSFRRA